MNILFIIYYNIKETTSRGRTKAVRKNCEVESDEGEHGNVIIKLMIIYYCKHCRQN